MPRPRLSIPKVLAVSVLALGCPADDDGDTGNDTGAAATESGTADDTGATSAAVPDCASHDEATCNADAACFWEGTEIGCLVACSMLEDQATCDSVPYCEWFEDACYSTI